MSAFCMVEQLSAGDDVDKLFFINDVDAVSLISFVGGGVFPSSAFNASEKRESVAAMGLEVTNSGEDAFSA